MIGADLSGVVRTNVIKIHNEEQNNVYVQLNTKEKQDILKNRSSLKPIIQTIRLCRRQPIALRGHADSGRIEINEPTENDGHFRCLLRFKANNGDIVLKEHLEMSDLNAMYTSPQIQNEIITIFGELIQSEIVKQISKSSFFSVLADETTDISQIEQFSVSIRYLDEESMIVRENFSAFIPVQDVTGEGLTNTLLETLKNLRLNLEKMRGQGYDGAATMSGAFNGVQVIVRKKYPKALYTHCISHSLNLCLSDASKAQDIRNAFGTVSECCAFFHYSAKRTHILKEKVLEINPKTQAHKLKSQYASIIWSSDNIGVNHNLEAIQNRFLRSLAFKLKIERLLHSNYNGVLSYFNIESLNTGRSNLHYSFLLKLLNNSIDCPYLL
ncbi:52 kDa repressor of the inhibitor of the protein kinase-like [Aphis gossypii]|uniref:52 kDa repressor of the inhibitor of the protein kinase-like n=1 Tax=Aphis gossypii TaxID=80765 RepID=UPI002159216B|nr:52 kDa repressor of the inhibitor of the protein kinase-like [Aphis gossypii]